MTQPWETLSSEELLDCRPWLAVQTEHVRLPNGHEIDRFYRIEMPEWTQVFALTDDGRVPLIEHWKQGARMVSLELPAGYLEIGEAPESGARRELREETGVEASAWRYLGRFFMDGNRGCGASHIFLAQEARVVAPPHREESEIMTQHWLTLDELRTTWTKGRIRNIATIAAIGLALAALEGDHAPD